MANQDNIELSSPSQQQNQKSAEGRTLHVHFSWKKFKTLITEGDDPKSKPLYIVDYKSFKPNLIFTNAQDKTTFGTGTLHPVSINADCDFRGRHIQIKALKRWKTAYEHHSLTYSDTETPVTMTWTSDSDFKTWDFICLDPQQNPVAKFAANLWDLKKIGKIEFLGPKAAMSEALREELLVTGMTLFYCMTLRATSIVSFFGAIFARPGHVEPEGPTTSEHVPGVEEGRVPGVEESHVGSSSQSH
ncbi:uncharacterized protein LY89DRAFT_242550 [Mollisia scopiformis]|uniref:Uncharacterized protein n=1 Tax=Mollisia scopiformis TaxID=149040 RepID=A0A194WUI3_MOLSC|nr:uncharacterized protein LY89DRAFT_242550 [Mollisia scopiformis]KUJ11329.1 hypothetical protein LY89DRAFT_242550 [Mollisia scopiformis]